MLTNTNLTSHRKCNNEMSEESGGRCDDGDDDNDDDDDCDT